MAAFLRTGSLRAPLLRHRLRPPVVSLRPNHALPSHSRGFGASVQNPAFGHPQQPRRAFLGWVMRQLYPQNAGPRKIDPKATQEAQDLFEKAQSLQVESRQDLLELSGILSEALDSDPRLTPASLLLGHTYHLLGMYEESIDVLKAASMQKPLDTKVSYHLAAVKSDQAMKALKNSSMPDRRGKVRANIQKKELELVVDAVTEFQHSVALSDFSADRTTVFSTLSKFSLWGQTMQDGNAFAAIVLLRALHILERTPPEEQPRPSAVSRLLANFTEATTVDISQQSSASRLIAFRMVEHFIQYVKAASKASESISHREKDAIVLDELQQLLSKIEMDPVQTNSMSPEILAEIKRVVENGPYNWKPKKSSWVFAEAGTYQAVGLLATGMIDVPKFNVLSFPELRGPVKGLTKSIAELGELAFKRAIETDPAILCYKDLIAVQLVLGKADEAIAFVKTIRESMMSAEEQRAIIVWSLISAQRWQDAEAEALKAVEDYPESVLLHLGLARLSLHETFAEDEERGAQRALHHAKLAEKLKPGADARSFVRKVEDTLERHEKGESSADIWFNKENLRQQGVVKKMVLRSFRLHESGRSEGAIQVLEEAIERFPDVPYAYLHIANLRLEAAEKNFLAAHQAAGQDEQAMETAKQQRLDAVRVSADSLKKYVQLSPDDAQGHQSLANLSFQLGDLALAKKHTNLSIAAPNATKAEFFQSADLIANIALQEKDTPRLKEATAALKRVLLMDMDYFPAHLRLCVYLGCLGEIEEAEHHLGRARALAKDSASERFVQATAERLKFLSQAHESKGGPKQD